MDANLAKDDFVTPRSYVYCAHVTLRDRVLAGLEFKATCADASKIMALAAYPRTPIIKPDEITSFPSHSLSYDQRAYDKMPANCQVRSKPMYRTDDPRFQLSQTIG